ncbi:MAG: haloalkane dehalogenase [Acidobacteriota bacterium]
MSIETNSPVSWRATRSAAMRTVLALASLLFLASSGPASGQATAGPTLVLQIDNARSQLEWVTLVPLDSGYDLLRAPLDVGGRLSITPSGEGFQVDSAGVSISGSGEGFVPDNTIEVAGDLVASIAATRRSFPNRLAFALADDHQLTLANASISRRLGDSEAILEGAELAFTEQRRRARIRVNLGNSTFRWRIEATADLEIDGRIEPTAIHGVLRGDVQVIDEAFPFTSRFIDVLGSELRYVDEGSGDPTFLLLHGNPTSTYLWRNVIPHLTPRGRTIAVDLIGFGASAKPDIDYTFLEHSAHIDAFIEALDLRDIILVVHDWGGAIGLNYAARNPDNVAGVVFFETFLRPFDSLEQAFGPSSGDPANPSLFDLFGLMRTGVEEDPSPQSGWELNVRQNFFVEQLLPAAIVRPLTAFEQEQYEAPFLDESSRLPVWRLPREIPIAGISVGGSTAVAEALDANVDFLLASPIPKLSFFATPGILIQATRDLPLIESFPNITVVPFGAGIHYLQEDDPQRIGSSVVEWLDANF